MTRVHKILASILMGLAPTWVLAAATSTSLPAPSAAQIVEKNVAARGGLAAWRAVQTMTWKGKMGAGGTTYEAVSPAGKLQRRERPEVELPFVLEFKRPLKSRVELEFNGQTAVQVYDGVTGWKLRPFLGRNDWDQFTPEELKLMAQEPGIDGFLIDYAAKGAKVDLIGTDQVEDRGTYKLKVTLKGGETRQVWVDGQTFIEAKVEGASRRLDGKPHAVEIYFRDYRPESGVVMPHVLETHVQGINRVEKITIENVTVNPKLDDLRFAKVDVAGASAPSSGK